MTAFGQQRTLVGNVVRPLLLRDYGHRQAARAGTPQAGQRQRAGGAGGIKADKRCRTNVPHIFSVGDVIGGYMLAHTAGQQGRVAAATILGEAIAYDEAEAIAYDEAEAIAYDEAKDSGVIFTRPEAGFRVVPGPGQGARD